MELSQLGADLLKALRERGWAVEMSNSREPLLPSDVLHRYPRVPVELTDFLGRIESCVNADENI